MWSEKAREASAAARRAKGTNVAGHAAAAEAHRMAMGEHAPGSMMFLHHEKMVGMHAQIAGMRAEGNALRAHTAGLNQAVKASKRERAPAAAPSRPIPLGSTGHHYSSGAMIAAHPHPAPSATYTPQSAASRRRMGLK